MLRSAFALELRRVVRMTSSAHIVRGVFSGRYTAIRRGNDLAPRIGFIEANGEGQISRFGGMTRNHVQRVNVTGAQIMNAQTRG